MHPQFLDILCCPATGEPLRLEARESRSNGRVVSGDLVNPEGRRYPILRGIPRFVGDERYASSFGYEWARWPRVQFESENVGRPMAGHTTRMWETICAADRHDARDKTIVEFGCGSGRFLDVVRRKGGRAVGLDITVAVESARRNFADDPDVLIVQADMFHPPFRRGAFDGAYSIGVLHHTPDPAMGARRLAESVRPGGWVAVCVYPRQGTYALPSVARMRRLNRLVKPILGYWPAVGYAYLSAYLLEPAIEAGKRVRWLRRWMKAAERDLLVCLHIPDARWRALDTFDAITPQVASTHTQEEVRRWLEEAGCRDVSRTGWGETSLVGVRMQEPN